MQPFGENTSNIPAFLGKLWKMVNDPSTDHLICWSPAGNSFIIQNQAHFWYELLPLYYKHNNMSSFVRQLNMYGFHKMSTVENGTMDADKDEIQFYHKYFQKDQPELLKNIKRKVTTSKSSENNMQNVIKSDDITKVLTDVKQLRGRQSSVDSQLSAMKQENAVLWRELAILRQKHLKQQQIVNKLIQFLVTLVQPTAGSRMGVGVKRRMPLMLHESPTKKAKPRKRNENDTGPTIHEIESEITHEELLTEPDIEAVQSPQATSTSSTSPKSNDLSKPPLSVTSNEGNVENAENLLGSDFWDKPEFVEIDNLQPDYLINDNELAEENINTLQNNTNQTNKEVFLNPSARDTLLTNLTSGSYNTDTVPVTKNGKKISSNLVGSGLDSNVSNTTNDNNDMTVAKINNGEDLDLHLESTQSEIEQLRDLLHGYTSFDANTLLGLFNEEGPDYGLTRTPNEHDRDNSKATTNTAAADPMVSGTELANVGSNLIDFNELLDDSFDGQEPMLNVLSQEDLGSSLVKSEPMFNVLDKDL